LGTAKAVTISQAGQNALYTFSGALNQRITVALSGSTIDFGFVALLRPRQHAESGWLWYG